MSWQASLAAFSSLLAQATGKSASIVVAVSSNAGRALFARKWAKPNQETAALVLVRTRRLRRNHDPDCLSRSPNPSKFGARPRREPNWLFAPCAESLTFGFRVKAHTTKCRWRGHPCRTGVILDFLTPLRSYDRCGKVRGKATAAALWPRGMTGDRGGAITGLKATGDATEERP